MGKRKTAWRFSAVWTFPGHMVGTTSTDPSRLQHELRQLDIQLKRLVMEAERLPLYLRNIELKYKLSDWELARTKSPIHLPVQGYIQSKNHYSIDLDNLKLWFDANWSPIVDQLRKDQTYLEWAKEDPAYRHVQVSGEPAVARAGRHKKEKQVRRAPTSSRSVPVLLSRISYFALNFVVTLIDSCPLISESPQLF